MKTLHLLRHAKSDWSDDGLSDHDRPLAARGEKACPAMGRYLAGHGLIPDRILCSTARRTRDTLARVTSQWGRTPPTDYDETLYLASSARILRRVADAPDEAASLMVVGHNPGLDQVLERLAVHADDEARRNAAEKFPTCAFAAIELPIDRWAEVVGAEGRLVHFATPRTLR